MTVDNPLEGSYFPTAWKPSSRYSTDPSDEMTGQHSSYGHYYPHRDSGSTPRYIPHPSIPGGTPYPGYVHQPAQSTTTSSYHHPGEPPVSHSIHGYTGVPSYDNYHYHGYQAPDKTDPSSHYSYPPPVPAPPHPEPNPSAWYTPQYPASTQPYVDTNTSYHPKR